MKIWSPIRLLIMLTLQGVLLLGVLSTDFHYLLEHHDDEEACTASTGENHYHESDEDHFCFLGHLPGWHDHFQQIELPAAQLQLLAAAPLPDCERVYTSTLSNISLRGPPAAV